MLVPFVFPMKDVIRYQDRQYDGYDQLAWSKQTAWQEVHLQQIWHTCIPCKVGFVRLGISCWRYKRTLLNSRWLSRFLSRRLPQHWVQLLLPDLQPPNLKEFEIILTRSMDPPFALPCDSKPFELVCWLPSLGSASFLHSAHHNEYSQGRRTHIYTYHTSTQTRTKNFRRPPYPHMDLRFAVRA